MVLPHLLLTTLLPGFLPQATTTVTSIIDKIAFDLDYIGRAREIARIRETAEVAYTRANISVNIVVWNMHIPEQHNFREILETGLQPMGRGGGFRVVVFQGEGRFTNLGQRASHNCLYSGNYVEKDHQTVVFRHVSHNERWLRIIAACVVTLLIGLVFVYRLAR